MAKKKCPYRTLFTFLKNESIFYKRLPSPVAILNCIRSEIRKLILVLTDKNVGWRFHLTDIVGLLWLAASTTCVCCSRCFHIYWF